MNKYKFYQDEKVTMWQRHHFTIEAESEDQAKEIAMKFANESIFDTDAANWHNESEFLFDTQETMSVEENGGCATLELYDWNKNELGNNAE